MGSGWDAFCGRFGVVGSLFRFLWKQRLWWMAPLIFVLLILGMLLIFAQQSAIAPFIYTLF
ncbi:MAG: hypothetical protein COV76_04660 [Candidatus Omnitrophica bacterium CG11_big_fil_rev_8_21_14_0_20_64_10]|nr:MAG: hypothetical protein COV76_04660 [Candidatus Omnitrophica bacterium CG11_big_fil_rev_8_21_14_0_20_64_10]